MPDTVTITTLVENTVNVAGLRGEHGLCFLLRADGRSLLFDTGQSDLLVHNARHMGLALENIEAIVLSHGHYDHTGGIAAALGAAPQAQLYCHPAAIEPKFGAYPDGSARYIGFAPPFIALARTPADRVLWTKEPHEIIPGIFATGEIPRTNDFEDSGGRFFLDAGCTRPDPLLDDQALYFDTDQGLVVILGCAHAGAVNTLEYISGLTGNRPIHAVLGGMHLVGAGATRMKRTIEALGRWSPRKLMPAHCTGSAAVAQLWASFPDCCCACPVGTNLVFHR